MKLLQRKFWLLKLPQENFTSEATSREVSNVKCFPGKCFKYETAPREDFNCKTTLGQGLTLEEVLALKHYSGSINHCLATVRGMLDQSILWYSWVMDEGTKLGNNGMSVCPKTTPEWNTWRKFCKTTPPKQNTLTTTHPKWNNPYYILFITYYILHTYYLFNTVKQLRNIWLKWSLSISKCRCLLTDDTDALKHCWWQCTRSRSWDQRPISS